MLGLVLGLHSIEQSGLRDPCRLDSIRREMKPNEVNSISYVSNILYCGYEGNALFLDHTIVPRITPFLSMMSPDLAENFTSLFIRSTTWDGKHNA